MGHVILLGSPKGGTGKSTTSCNLAAKYALDGYRTKLIDADMQGSAHAWSQRREAHDAELREKGGAGLPFIPCVKLKGQIHRTIRSEAETTDILIVDTGGYDSVEFRTALTAADAVFIPLRTSQIDLDLIPHISDLLKTVAELLRVEELNARILMNIVTTHPGSKDLAGSREYLSENSNLQYARSAISNRRIYQDTMGEGLGVLESTHRDAKKAIPEINALADEVLEVASQPLKEV